MGLGVAPFAAPRGVNGESAKQRETAALTDLPLPAGPVEIDNIVYQTTRSSYGIPYTSWQSFQSASHYRHTHLHELAALVRPSCQSLPCPATCLESNKPLT
jgi:hypothetical protein